MPLVMFAVPLALGTMIDAASIMVALLIIFPIIALYPTSLKI